MFYFIYKYRFKFNFVKMVKMIKAEILFLRIQITFHYFFQIIKSG